MASESSTKKFKCQIIENNKACENDSARTLGRDKITTACKEERLEINARSKVTKIKVCKEHYRKIKKHMKKDSKIDRIRWGI